MLTKYIATPILIKHLTMTCIIEYVVLEKGYYNYSNDDLELKYTMMGADFCSVILLSIFVFIVYLFTSFIYEAKQEKKRIEKEEIANALKKLDLNDDQVDIIEVKTK